MFRKIICLVLLIAFPSAWLHADDHEGGGLGVVDLIPFKLAPGKDMNDFMALRDRFAKTLGDLNAQYSAWVLTPLFVNQAATGVAEDFDAIWFGAAPSASAFADAHAGYLKKAAALERSFSEVRRNVQRNMLNLETVYLGPRDNPEPNVVMLSTCTPTANLSVQNAVTELREIAKSLAGRGSKGSTFLWHGGLGASEAHTGKWFLARSFPDLKAWGQAMTAYRAGKFADIMLKRRGLMHCSSPRVYLSDLFYNHLG